MRLLHTMIRVGNLEKSISFYTGILGMKLLRQSAIDKVCQGLTSLEEALAINISEDD